MIKFNKQILIRERGVSKEYETQALLIAITTFTKEVLNDLPESPLRTVHTVGAIIEDDGEIRIVELSKYRIELCNENHFSEKFV